MSTAREERKPLTNQDEHTAMDGVYDARGARLTHSQTAKPLSKYQDTTAACQPTGVYGARGANDPDEKKSKERTHSG